MQISSPDKNPKGMLEAKHLAKAGRKKQLADKIDIKKDTLFSLQGAKLLNCNQASLYRLIKGSKWVEPRLQTRIKLAATVYAVAEVNNGKMPVEEEVWKSIRNNDTPKPIRGFLCKNLHRAYKIGNYWQSIPG